MIPRLLHHIWLGPREVPDQWGAAWRDMHPGWTHRVWREADIEALPETPARPAYRRLLADGVWHGAADVARLEVLWHRGGVYVDIDSRPLRSLEGAPFMSAGVFAGFEPVPSLPGRVANGTIGAEPGHEAIGTALDLLGKMRVLDPPWDTTGGTLLTAVLALHRRCCDIRIEPARTFYATDAKGRPVAGPGESYIQHFWATTNNTYPARVVVLVPRRAGDPVRDRIWKWARDIWGQQGWPVVEGHHPGPGLFNASMARNRAAEAAGSEWDVAIFTDADTLPWDWSPVREAVDIAHRTGRFVRPFTRYWMLDADASETFMREGRIPERGVQRLREEAHGGIHLVSRRLWETVRGYDERFVGWGWEDTAFEAACTALAGKVALPGDVYHLWHPHQPRDPSTPEYRANVALGRRYVTARPQAMRRLIAEREDGVVSEACGATLLILTNGRREWLPRTVASIDRWVGPLSVRLIVDDSGDPEYLVWLRETFPGFRVIGHRHLGHGPAVHQALLAGARAGQPWVFVCEDDMEFTDRVDLSEMARVMDADPDLVQMVIKRQAWFPAEVAAGPTLIDRFPEEDFTEVSDGRATWLEHRRFYSMNPHLVRASFLGSHPWPAKPNSEHHFGLRLFRDQRVRSGMWGSRAEPPRVLHIGAERTGTGY